MSFRDLLITDEQRRPTYGIVALDAAVLAMFVPSFLLEALLYAHASQASRLQIALGLLESLVCAFVLIAGIVLEVGRKRLAVWVNIGWPALLSILVPLSFLAIARREHTPHRAIVFILITTAAMFQLLLGAVAVLYAIAFKRKRDLAIAAEDPTGCDLVKLQQKQAARRDAFATIGFYLAFLMCLYPVLYYVYLHVHYARTSQNLDPKTEADLTLLLFLTSMLSVWCLAMCLRASSARKLLGATVSVLAMLLNFGLLFLASLAE